MKATSGFAVLLLLSSCRIFDPAFDEIGLEDSWSRSADARNPEESDVPRSVCVDLDSVWRLARGEPLGVLAARARLATAEADESVADARFVPNLQIVTGFSDRDGRLQATTGEFPDVTRQETSISLGATTSLHLGRALYESAAASHRRDAAADALDAEVQSAMLMAAVLYLDLVGAVEDVGIAEEARRLALGALQIITSRLESGSGVRADVEQAAAREASEAVAVSEAQFRAKSASIALAAHLRLDPSTVLVPTDVILPLIPWASDLDVRRLLALAMARNPEVASAARSVDSARSLTESAALAPLIPTIEAGVDFGQRGTTPGSLDGSRGSFVMLRWELGGAGFGSAAEHRRARSLLQQSRIEASGTRERIGAAVVRTVAELDARRGALGAAEHAVAAAESAVALIKARLEQGQGILLDLLDAQAGLSRARRARLATVTAFDRAVLALLALVGERDLP